MTLALPGPRPRRRKVVIGPEDDGKRMSLDRFDHATAREGYLYVLGKGVIEVSEVPSVEHGKQVQELRNQLVVYQLNHPDGIDYLSGSNDAKLLIGSAESKRHPDLMVYLSPAPDVEEQPPAREGGRNGGNGGRNGNDNDGGGNGGRNRGGNGGGGGGGND